MAVTLTWEQLATNGGMGRLNKTYRASIPNGWLVKEILEYSDPEFSPGICLSITFVPDPGHTWNT